MLLGCLSSSCTRNFDTLAQSRISESTAAKNATKTCLAGNYQPNLGIVSMRDSATSAMRGWELENPGKTGWLRVGAVSRSADFTGKFEMSTFRLRGSLFVYEKAVPNKPQNKKLLI
jgi:hypothetical protein